MARRTGHPVYEVDGYLVADVTATVTGDESGSTPGTPSSGASGGSLTAVTTARSTLNGLFVAQNYGVVLDGAADGSTGTDSSAALNAAITAANAAWVTTGAPQTVLIANTGNSIAVLGSAVVLKSGVTLRIGSGVTLVRKSGLVGNLITNAAATPLRTMTDGAITAAANVLTSATANFTSADIGRSVYVQNAGDSGNASLQTDAFYAYITGVTDAQTATLSLNAITTVSGKNVSIWTRDRDIAIIGEPGATISYGTNSATSQTLAGCHSYLRNIDGVAWQGTPGAPMKVTTVSGTGGGKYAIFFYACTKARAADIDFNTQSDGVHIQGKSDDIRVQRITGTTNDDSVAIVVPDRGGIVAGDLGNVTNFLIEDISTTTGASTNGVRILPGTYLGGTASAEVYTISKGTIRGVRGSHGGAPVQIGNTANPSSPSPYFGGTVDELIVEDVPRDANNKYVQIICMTIPNLTLRRVQQVSVGLQVIADVITLEDCFFDLAASQYGVSCAATSVGTFRFRRCRIKVASTTGGILNHTAGTVATVHIDDVVADRCAWPVGSYSGTTSIFYRGVRAVTTSGIFVVTTTGVVTVREAGTEAVTETITVSGSGVLKGKTAGLRVDLSKLAKASAVNGDQAFNLNAALTPVSGTAAGLVGPCVYDGTNWKNVASGSTF